MGKNVVRTEAAPAPFQGAPYSQAIVAGGFVFTAGQVGLQAGGSGLAGRHDRGADRAGVRQSRRHPRGCRSGLDRLVKTTVYLADLGRVRRHERGLSRSYVGDQPPARATFEVAALPAGALVEIEAVALA